jgi:hypothetical protein
MQAARAGEGRGARGVRADCNEPLAPLVLLLLPLLLLAPGAASFQPQQACQEEQQVVAGEGELFDQVQWGTSSCLWIPSGTVINIRGDMWEASLGRQLAISSAAPPAALALHLPAALLLDHPSSRLSIANLTVAIGDDGRLAPGDVGAACSRFARAAAGSVAWQHVTLVLHTTEARASAWSAALQATGNALALPSATHGRHELTGCTLLLDTSACAQPGASSPAPGAAGAGVPCLSSLAAAAAAAPAGGAPSSSAAPIVSRAACSPRAPPCAPGTSLRCGGRR